LAIGDAYRPVPKEAIEPSAPPEEPVVTGTLFFMALLLMFIFGFWIMMYVTLLNR
jgi:hypothetical protein